LCTKLPMLPKSPVEVGVPSDVHPANAIAVATTVAVRKRIRTGDRERSTPFVAHASPDPRDGPYMMEPKAKLKTWLGPGRGRQATCNFNFLENESLSVAALWCETLCAAMPAGVGFGRAIS
jgi:hypothetical protein